MSEASGEASAEAGESPGESSEEAPEEAGSEECVNHEYMSDSDSEEYSDNSQEERTDRENTESQELTQEEEESDVLSLESKLAEEGIKREGIVEYLKSKGLSKGKITEMLKSKYSIEDMPNLPRSFFYLVRAFLDTGSAKGKDPYEKISKSNGTPVLYFPGFLDIPDSVEQIEEHTGLNIIRVDTRDTEEMDRIIEHAWKETGQKPVLAGFSDGRIRIQDYLAKYGRGKVSEVFVIAGQKTIPNAIYIDGANDKLAPIEKGYFRKIDSGSVREVIPGMGHVDLVYNPKAIRQIGDIITSYTRVSKGPLYHGLRDAA